MKLLLGEEILPAVVDLMGETGQARLAVAYWGHGGAEKSGVLERAAGSTQVLCDLYSGACNPKEMLRLLRVGVELRTYDKLHAKIWVTDNAIIVGSANASADGLNFKGPEARGNVEAAALLRDERSVSRAREWFDDLWSAATIIDENLIEAVLPLWREKSEAKGRLHSQTLFAALQSEPRRRRLRSARVVLYQEGDASEEAHAKHAESAHVHSNAQLRIWPGQDPFYEDDHGSWDVAPGDIIIDFEVAQPRARPKFYGIWRVRSEPFVRAPKRGAPHNRIILCDPVPGIEGHPIPKAERKALSDLLVERAIQSKWSEDSSANMVDVPLLDLVPVSVAQQFFAAEGTNDRNGPKR